MGRARKMKRAEDYGDDPRIRHSYGEHTQTSEQPWEQAYVRYKKSTWQVAEVKGRKARIVNPQGESKWVRLERLVRL